MPFVLFQFCTVSKKNNTINVTIDICTLQCKYLDNVKEDNKETKTKNELANEQQLKLATNELAC